MKSQILDDFSLTCGKFPLYHQNMETLDALDRKILVELQRDAAQSLDHLGDSVGLSRNACWRRIKAMETTGILKGRVALVDPDAVGLGLMVFMQIRTGSHDPDWQAKFSRATHDIPGILSVYRMTGDLDYLIRARVADMPDYDRLYQHLITRLPIADISASFVMEEIKDSTALPL